MDPLAPGWQSRRSVGRLIHLVSQFRNEAFQLLEALLELGVFVFRLVALRFEGFQILVDSADLLVFLGTKLADGAHGEGGAASGPC